MSGSLTGRWSGASLWIKIGAGAVITAAIVAFALFSLFRPNIQIYVGKHEICNLV